MDEQTRVVSNVFQEHFANLSQALQSQIDTVAIELFSCQLIPQDVLDYEAASNRQTRTSKVLMAFQNAQKASEHK